MAAAACVFICVALVTVAGVASPRFTCSDTLLRLSFAGISAPRAAHTILAAPFVAHITVAATATAACVAGAGDGAAVAEVAVAPPVSQKCVPCGQGSELPIVTRGNWRLCEPCPDVSELHAVERRHLHTLAGSARPQKLRRSSRSYI